MSIPVCGSSVILCKEPWVTKCGKPATVAYLDKRTSEISYRCRDHQFRLKDTSPLGVKISTIFGDRMTIMTIEEAIVHEVISV